MKPISLGVFKIQWLDKRANKRYTAYRMNTVKSKFFTDLYSVFYVNGRKTVPGLIIENADEIALAILVGDGGTFDKNSKTIKISVDAYDHQSRINIATWLNRKFNIEYSTLVQTRYTHVIIQLLYSNLSSETNPTSRRNQPS